MEFTFLQLLYRLVELDAVYSFRVTKDKIYIIIKK